MYSIVFTLNICKYILLKTHHLSSINEKPCMDQRSRDEENLEVENNENQCPALPMGHPKRRP